jgi:hypothetical protein
MWVICLTDHMTTLHPQKLALKFRQHVAIAQFVYFACELRAMEFVITLIFSYGDKIWIYSDTELFSNFQEFGLCMTNKFTRNKIKPKNISVFKGKFQQQTILISKPYSMFLQINNVSY